MVRTRVRRIARVPSARAAHRGASASHSLDRALRLRLRMPSASVRVECVCSCSCCPTLARARAQAPDENRGEHGAMTWADSATWRALRGRFLQNAVLVAGAHRSCRRVFSALFIAPPLSCRPLGHHAALGAWDPSSARSPPAWGTSHCSCSGRH